MMMWLWHEAKSYTKREWIVIVNSVCVANIRIDYVL